jgi:hypothetical protein
VAVVTEVVITGTVEGGDGTASACCVTEATGCALTLGPGPGTGPGNCPYLSTPCFGDSDTTGTSTTSITGVGATVAVVVAATGTVTGIAVTTVVVVVVVGVGETVVVVVGGTAATVCFSSGGGGTLPTKGLGEALLSWELAVAEPTLGLLGTLAPSWVLSSFSELTPTSLCCSSGLSSTDIEAFWCAWLWWYRNPLMCLYFLLQFGSGHSMSTGDDGCSVGVVFVGVPLDCDLDLLPIFASGGVGSSNSIGRPLRFGPMQPTTES